MDDLSQQYQWIGECVNKIDVTNVGAQHDLTDLLRPVDLVLQEDNLLIRETNQGFSRLGFES